MSNFLLTQIINYGAPLFALALFLGALGFPVGASLLVIAAGAFSEQGILSWPVTAVFGLVGTLIGDSLSYGIGYFAKAQMEDRFGKSSAWQSAQATFERRGAWAVYLTRFLITSLAIPTNLIAGGSNFGFWRFFFYDFAGELTWIILYGGLGYLFGNQWELVGAFVTNFGKFLLGVILLIAGFMLAKRILARTSQKNAGKI
jgi:membrane protein DedA with SNARE-associated domain